ncbi:MAG: C40 family peptidase [Spirochaetes bacterium]|nr:C40 family peptidase [Spirochaetota bacterium]
MPLMIRFMPLFLCALLLSATGPNAGRTEEELRAAIILTAKKHLGALYRYGGMGARGFDCSGFAQFVYRENGIALPRSTVDQYERGRKIDLADAKQGDLLFFKIYRNRVSHVGIYVDKSTFIHAPTWGKRVSFANMNLDYWKRTFVGAATYIGVKAGPAKADDPPAP